MKVMVAAVLMAATQVGSLSINPRGAFAQSAETRPAAQSQSPAQTQLIPQAATAIASPPTKPADVASIDSIIAALYDVISGPAGKRRDWNRMRSLFIPEGRLIPVVPRREGGFRTRVLSVEDYIKSSGNYIETKGFFEREVGRKQDRYENLVHAFSAYEGRHKMDDAQPFVRGTNSIQLMFDGSRWWIVNVTWDSERPAHPASNARQ